MILEGTFIKKEIISSNLILDIKKIIEFSKKQVVKNVNTIMLQTYWNIGKRIVEEEQNGNDKADYGKALINNFAKELTIFYGKVFLNLIFFL